MKSRRLIRRIVQFLKRENLHTVILWVVILVVASSAAITFLEPGMSFLNAVWWSIVTLTTVGYGDISPATPGGRLVAVLIMFFGIGVLGILSATLASILISRKLREHKGMNSFDFEDHIIICEWNHRTRAILRELRADPRHEETPVVLIADIDEKPVEDENLFFIRGGADEETLRRANITKARTAIVLGDDRLETIARDARVVLATLTIESISPETYTVVELVDQSNVQHCKRARADEIIVGSEFSSHLIASSAINHGISRIVSELLSLRQGNDLRSIRVPQDMAGSKFIEVFTRMKQESQAIVLGVQKGRTGEPIANPPVDYVVEEDDRLIIVAHVDS